ncbi:MAG: hypothetical protein P8K65_08130 [Acidimicrobiales bacterium]|nr:hypothetical protein [Acidimicrobiales bacterium]
MTGLVASRVGGGLVGGLMVAVLAIGCGGAAAPTFDLEAIEAEVPTLLVPAYPGAVIDVDCGDPDPDGLGPVACTAILAGAEVRVLVHRPSIDGRIRVESSVELVEAVDVAAAATARLESDLGVVNSLVCSPAVRVAREGQTFACTATDPDGGDHHLVATLLDGDGAFRLDLDFDPDG